MAELKIRLQQVEIGGRRSLNLLEPALRKVSVTEFR